MSGLVRASQLGPCFCTAAEGQDPGLQCLRGRDLDPTMAMMHSAAQCTVVNTHDGGGVNSRGCTSQGEAPQQQQHHLRLHLPRNPAKATTSTFSTSGKQAKQSVMRKVSFLACRGLGFATASASASPVQGPPCARWPCMPDLYLHHGNRGPAAGHGHSVLMVEDAIQILL